MPGYPPDPLAFPPRDFCRWGDGGASAASAASCEGGSKWVGREGEIGLVGSDLKMFELWSGSSDFLDADFFELLGMQKVVFGVLGCGFRVGPSRNQYTLLPLVFQWLFLGARGCLLVRLTQPGLPRQSVPFFFSAGSDASPQCCHQPMERSHGLLSVCFEFDWLSGCVMFFFFNGMSWAVFMLFSACVLSFCLFL